MDWQDLALTSHYGTAKAVQQQLLMGDVEEALTGIEELTEALGRSDRNAVENQLERLMMHVIKWKIQPDRRSRSWALTILNARSEIRRKQKEHPSLGKNFIQTVWEECFRNGKDFAETETGITADAIESLSWKEVFEDDYRI